MNPPATAATCPGCRSCMVAGVRHFKPRSQEVPVMTNDADVDLVSAGLWKVTDDGFQVVGMMTVAANLASASLPACAHAPDDLHDDCFSCGFRFAVRSMHDGGPDV